MLAALWSWRRGVAAVELSSSKARTGTVKSILLTPYRTEDNCYGKRITFFMWVVSRVAGHQCSTSAAQSNDSILNSGKTRMHPWVFISPTTVANTNRATWQHQEQTLCNHLHRLSTPPQLLLSLIPSLPRQTSPADQDVPGLKE